MKKQKGIIPYRFKKALVKDYVILGFFLITIPFLLGMGSMGGEKTPENIPVPERNFKVRLIDREDVSIELTQFSFDGSTHLTGRLGKGLLSIPFNEINKITILIKGNECKAIVHTKDGKTLEILIPKDKNFYGKSKWGSYLIRSIDIKEILFLHELSK